MIIHSCVAVAVVSETTEENVHSAGEDYVHETQKQEHDLQSSVSESGASAYCISSCTNAFVLIVTLSDVSRKLFSFTHLLFTVGQNYAQCERCNSHSLHLRCFV